jgi:hypothetical protein
VVRGRDPFSAGFRIVKKELEAAGVEPAFDPRKVGATFYSKVDLVRGRE